MRALTERQKSRFGVRRGMQFLDNRQFIIELDHVILPRSQAKELTRCLFGHETIAHLANIQLGA